MHYLFYIVAGIMVSGYSKFVGSKNPSGFFEVFFWIGLLFLLYGLGKIAFKKITKEQSTKVPKIDNANNNFRGMKTCPKCQLSQYEAFDSCVQCGYMFRNTY